jgi:hypothetical protein
MIKQPTKAFVTSRMQLAQILHLFWNMMVLVVALIWVGITREKQREREKKRERERERGRERERDRETFTADLLKSFRVGNII